MRLITRLAFLTVVALVPLVAGCSTVALPGNIPPLPTPVPDTAPGAAASPSGTAYTVTRGSVSQSVSANIKVVANRQDALYFKASGQLGDMPVKVGDQVQQGDLLAQLNVRALQDQAALNTLTVKQNRVKLERTKQDTTMDYEIVDAQVAVVQAEAAIQNARLKLEKLQTPPRS
ncbi:MAG: biotin/lipoyl-binding protein, partial [Dehalococcoidia bacterium]|nr:biotin/lipoyl-binding protein [Dehalococcoidia bacterium]